MSPSLFEEIQVIGSKKVVKQIEAKLFPEKIFISDLLSNYSQMADAINEQEYLKLKGN